MVKKTPLYGFYEIGSITPVPIHSLIPKDDPSHDIRWGEHSYFSRLVSVHKSFCKLAQDTLDLRFQGFSESWVNPQMASGVKRWHNHGPHMLIAILSDDPASGTEMADCEVILRKANQSENEFLDYKKKAVDSLICSFVTKPWTLYYDLVGLYHRAIAGSDMIDRIMFRQLQQLITKRELEILSEL